MDRDDFLLALRSYWTVRADQASRSRGEGSGAAVRGGAQFDELQHLVAQVFLDLGYDWAQIKTRRIETILPGYFRATKNWDLVVVDDGVLVAAFELKSLGGPSYSNNFNNRLEEALGNAADLWRAYESGVLGPVRPWLGYLFVIEDSVGSRSPVGSLQPNFPVEQAFVGKSYCERATLMCERLLTERLYDAICLVTSSRDPAELPGEPSELCNWNNLVAAIQARVAYLRAR